MSEILDQGLPANRRIRSHPRLPGHVPIHGYIYDVKTGRLDLIAAATEAGKAR